jgi:4-hydroxybenzoate polyprenyltransferase
MTLARDLVRLFRPRQWYKNLLLFVGLVFSLHLFDARLALRATEGFAVFCVVASGVYALNDVIDAAEDRIHPKKRDRPVASGRLGEPAAAAMGVAAVVAGLAGAWLLSLPFFLVAAAYVALQVAYLLSLKHQVFLDLFSIAAGLVLRAIAGVVLVGVALSPWLVLCTFFLALFLGLGKRRNELHLLGEEARLHRRNLGDYSPRLLEQATTVVMSALIAFYSLYCFERNPFLMATIPFALYGLFRWLFLVGERNLGGEPEVVFRDPPSLVNLALWGALTVAILYVGPDRLAALFGGLGSGGA